MTWTLKLGKNRGWIEKLIREGYDLNSKGISENEVPVLDKRLIPAWNAYQDLMTSRRENEYGMGRVPVSEIKAYYELLGVMPISRQKLRQIQALDEAVVTLNEENINKKFNRNKEKPRN